MSQTALRGSVSRKVCLIVSIQFQPSWYSTPLFFCDRGRGDKGISRRLINQSSKQFVEVRRILLSYTSGRESPNVRSSNACSTFSLSKAAPSQP